MLLHLLVQDEQDKPVWSTIPLYTQVCLLLQYFHIAIPIFLCDNISQQTMYLVPPTHTKKNSPNVHLLKNGWNGWLPTEIGMKACSCWLAKKPSSHIFMLVLHLYAVHFARFSKKSPSPNRSVISSIGPRGLKFFSASRRTSSWSAILELFLSNRLLIQAPLHSLRIDSSYLQ